MVTLVDNFTLAKKPLNLLSERYIKLQMAMRFPQAA